MVFRRNIIWDVYILYIWLSFSVVLETRSQFSNLRLASHIINIGCNYLLILKFKSKNMSITNKNILLVLLEEWNSVTGQ